MSGNVTVGSLCSGYGGLEMAVPGGEVRWHAEIDPAAVSTLACHWPMVRNHGDIRDVKWSAVEPVDVLTAGFPCQPISLAGRRRHDADERWLWPEVNRAIDELRPATVFVENVESLVTVQSGALFSIVLADLMWNGYAVRWCLLGACAVGGCHHRHRLFLRADWMAGDVPEPSRVKTTKCGARRGAHRLLPTPRAADGGSGPGPMVGNANKRSGTGPRLVDVATHRLMDGWGEYATAVRIWTEVHGPPPEPTEPNARGGDGRWLNPRFAEWMMGLAPGYVTDHNDRLSALRLIGNGVMPHQSVAAWDVLAPDTATVTVVAA